MAELRIEGGIAEAVENKDGSIEVINTSEIIRKRVEALNLGEKEILRVSINSVGGSVYEGYAIYNYLRTFGNRLFIEGDGLIASISTLIMSAAPKENTSITEVSMFMVHRAAAQISGNAEEMDRKSIALKKIDQTLVDVYTKRTGIEAVKMLSMLSNETWLSGREAFDLGFVGNLTNQIPAEAVALAFTNLIKKNEMGLTQFINKFKPSAETTEEEKKKEEETKAVADEETKKDEETKAVSEEETKAALEEEVKPEEKPEETKAVSRDEFNALKEAMDKFAELLEGMLEANSEEAQATAETVDGLEEKVINATKSAFNSMVASLPSSSAMPNEATPIAKTSSDPYAGFKEKMEAVNKEAKAKLRKV